jgi:hypothetical protein
MKDVWQFDSYSSFFHYFAMPRASLLPAGWSTAVTKDGRVFFVNHVDRSTSWRHPITGAKWRSPAPFKSSSSTSFGDRSASLSPPRTRPSSLERVSPASCRTHRELSPSHMTDEIGEDLPLTRLSMQSRLTHQARDGYSTRIEGSRLGIEPRTSPKDKRGTDFIGDTSKSVDIDKLLQEVVQGRLGGEGLTEELHQAPHDPVVMSSMKSSPVALDREYNMEELKEKFSNESSARRKAEVALHLEMRRYVAVAAPSIRLHVAVRLHQFLPTIVSPGEFIPVSFLPLHLL